MPVGLLGLHTNTSLVLGVTAAAMASRSCVWSLSGTTTGTAPRMSITSRYDVKDGAASTTSSPRSSVACASRYSSSQVPQPTVTCSGLRSSRSATATRRSVENPSG